MLVQKGSLKMGRRYRITTPVTPEQGAEAIREIKERTQVKDVVLSDDLTTLTVYAEEDQYFPVLTNALNEFRRVLSSSSSSSSCELVFDRFVEDQ